MTSATTAAPRGTTTVVLTDEEIEIILNHPGSFISLLLVDAAGYPISGTPARGDAMDASCSAGSGSTPGRSSSHKLSATAPWRSSAAARGPRSGSSWYPSSWTGWNFSRHRAHSGDRPLPRRGAPRRRRPA